MLANTVIKIDGAPDENDSITLPKRNTCEVIDVQEVRELLNDTLMVNYRR